MDAVSAVFRVQVEQIRQSNPNFLGPHHLPQLKLVLKLGGKKKKVEELTPTFIKNGNVHFDQQVELPCQLRYRNGPGSVLKDKQLLFVFHLPTGKKLKWKLNIASAYGRVSPKEETLITYCKQTKQNVFLKILIEDFSNKPPKSKTKRYATIEDIPSEHELEKERRIVCSPDSPFQKKRSIEKSDTQEAPIKLVFGEHLGSKRQSRRSPSPLKASTEDEEHPVGISEGGSAPMSELRPKYRPRLLSANARMQTSHSTEAPTAIPNADTATQTKATSNSEMVLPPQPSNYREREQNEKNLSVETTPLLSKPVSKPKRKFACCYCCW